MVLCYTVCICKKKVMYGGDKKFMRVIAGIAKGHKLEAPEGLTTRPTTDRIKETLFNMMAFDLPECKFLDLFSGSGAIGIEALCRGAAEAVFVDSHKEAQNVIHKNLAHTKLSEKATVLGKDVFIALQELSAAGKVLDIIYMDPPYAAGVEQTVLEAIRCGGLLNKDGYIGVEHGSQYPLRIPAGYRLAREKSYKTTTITFLVLEETE